MGTPDDPNLTVSIRCRARRTAEPGAGPHTRRPRSPVSIRCRARRTAEPRVRGRAARLSVSIRCRARRTAEHHRHVGHVWDRHRFLFAVVRDVQRNNSGVANGTVYSSGSFYSLSCETYSGTPPVGHLPVRFRPFLFAVVRDVQRNQRRSTTSTTTTSFYSLSCETYSGTWRLGGRCRLRLFLFAVVRDVQRNLHQGRVGEHRHVSIRCRARRTAEPDGV